VIRLKKKAIPLIVWFAVLVILTAAPMVLAQNQTAVEGSSPLSDFLGQIGLIIPSSFVIAFATCMLGYLRNTPPEDFELVKFLTTLVLSIIVGVITVEVGWDYATIQVWLANVGITVWVYWTIKAIAVKLGWVTVEEAQKPT